MYPLGKDPTRILIQLPSPLGLSRLFISASNYWTQGHTLHQIKDRDVQTLVSSTALQPGSSLEQRFSCLSPEVTEHFLSVTFEGLILNLPSAPSSGSPAGS